MSKNADVPGPWARLPFGLKLHPDADVTRQYALSLLFLIIGSFIAAFTSEKTQFLYKETLHLSANRVATLNLILGISDYVSPLLAAGMELFPWFGYRRRSYFIVGVGVTAVGYLILGLLPVYAYTTVLPLMIAVVTGGTLRSIIVNAIFTEVGNRTGILARLQTTMTLIALTLSLTITSRLSGYVSAHWDYHPVYLVAALLTSFKFPLLFLMPDPRVALSSHTAAEEERQRVRAEQRAERQKTLDALRETWRDWRFRAAVALIAWTGLTPFPSSALIYYETDALHLSKQFIGNLGAWSAAGSFAALALFFALGPRLQVRMLPLLYVLVNVFTYLIFLGMYDARSAEICFVLNGFIGIFGNVATLILYARLCPRGVEGTVFAFLVAVGALFGQICDKWGTWLYDQYGPANTAAHYTIVHGWNVSLYVGLAMAVASIVFLPFLPLWTRSHEPLSAPSPGYDETPGAGDGADAATEGGDVPVAAPPFAQSFAPMSGEDEA